MQHKFCRLFFIIGAVAFIGIGALAQKPVNTAIKPAAKYKPPVVKSMIGKISANTTMNAAEAVQLITLPLKVTDEKNADYPISSYQFIYKRIGVTEDEETGKTKEQSDIAAQQFSTTPLPPLWQKNIAEGLHKGEELYFFDIIVLDKQGRRFFAPELKITIQ